MPKTWIYEIIMGGESELHLSNESGRCTPPPALGKHCLLLWHPNYAESGAIEDVNGQVKGLKEFPGHSLDTNRPKQWNSAMETLQGDMPTHVKEQELQLKCLLLAHSECFQPLMWWKGSISHVNGQVAHFVTYKTNREILKMGQHRWSYFRFIE